MDRPPPRVSLAAPACRPRFFGTALQSALRQPYGALEITNDDVLQWRCVARIVAAFKTLGQRVARVTGRRHVVDGSGAVLADTAATAPLATGDCTFNGIAFGDQVDGAFARHHRARQMKTASSEDKAVRCCRRVAQRRWSRAPP